VPQITGSWRFESAFDWYRFAVSGSQLDRDLLTERARREAARRLIAAYHEEQLLALLEHVRTGFQQLDAGEIDAFELDDLLFHYKRSAAELWKFCGSGGSQIERAASTLAYLRDEGREPDWWERGTPRRRS
jgi:hypothetical protein